MFETAWGLRRSLRKTISLGNKKAEQYFETIEPLELVAKETEQLGFPATVHKFRASYMGPYNAWKSYAQSTDERFIKNSERHELLSRLNEGTRILGIMDMEIKHPVPPVVDMSSEERLLHEIQVLKMSLGRLADAIDVFLSTVTLATNPIFLDAGNLKKEILRTISPKKLSTFQMIFEYKDKLIDLIQRAEILLARPTTYDLLKQSTRRSHE